MLDELIVRNLGVLEDVRFEPGPGLTVISGETGAGKTLLLGALRLLLGADARSDMVGPFDEESVAEGRFLDRDGTEVVVARRLSRTGRSRAYLDGSIASAAALDGAAGGRVEIIGQHDQLSLTRPSEIRTLVDRLLDEDGREAAAAYREAWDRHRAVEADIERLGGDRQALERERDLVTHQAAEIGRAGIEDDEEERLGSRLGRLRNAETLRLHVGATSDHLDAARDHVGSAVSELRKAAGFDPSLEGPVDDLGNLEDGLGDVAIALGSILQDLDAEPAELEAAEERWRVLADLRRKYGPGIGDVIEFGRRVEKRAVELEDLLGRADRLADERVEALERLAAAGELLRRARDRAATLLVERALVHLGELGFRTPRLVATVDAAEPGPAGTDFPALLFASDERLEPGEIRRVASGGELSRLVLSLRLAGGAGEAETVVFDEIDSGVGGATALAVGQKLAALAADRQVLCVTHLPQVAAHADVHYVIERDAASAGLRRVDGEDRIAELARMLAGLPDSDQGRQTAVALLESVRAVALAPTPQGGVPGGGGGPSRNA